MEDGKGEGAAPCWCDLDRDIMECILRKLCLVDVLRFKGVCSWWFSVAKGFAPSDVGYPPSSPSAAPWLLIPHIDHDDDRDDDEGAGRRAASGEQLLSRLSFFNPDEKKVIENVCECPEVYAGECIGSSHAWLVLLDTKANLSIFNPFLGDRIQVCSLEKVFDWLDAHDNFRCRDKCEEKCRTLIWKASLVPTSSSSTSTDEKNKNMKKKKMINKDKDAVFVIYGLHATEVGYCTLKEGSIFTHLGSTVGHYEYLDSFDDVICFRNMICAVTRGGNVQIWDFTSASSSSDHHPIIVADIRYNYERARDIFWKRLSETISFESRWSGENQGFYHGCNLVESCGELLHLMRFYVEYDHEYGMELSRLEMTLDFVVTRVDIHAKKVVEDYRPPRGDQVVFLDAMGTSISLNAEDCPECSKGSIYFTPPLRPGPIMFGSSPVAMVSSPVGIDMGIYNVKDLSVDPIYDTIIHTPHIKIKPLPFWFFPS